jgi:hypothetical protein
MLDHFSKQVFLASKGNVERRYRFSFVFSSEDKLSSGNRCGDKRYIKTLNAVQSGAWKIDVACASSRLERW